MLCLLLILGRLSLLTALSLGKLTITFVTRSHKLDGIYIGLYGLLNTDNRFNKTLLPQIFQPLSRGSSLPMKR